MNLSSVTYWATKKQTQTESALALLSPMAATGLVVSISDVIEHGQAIKQKRDLMSGLEKVRKAVEYANANKVKPEVNLNDEELTVLKALGTAAKDGLIGAAEAIGSALFSFVPFVIEMVVVPMFSIGTATVLGLLAALATPEGLVIGGAVGLVAAALYAYKNWNNRQQEQIPTSTAAESALPQNAAQGLRNNNPGNLVYAGQPGALPKTGTFAQFPTQALGLYNMGRQLELNYNRGLNTPDKMIRKWSTTDQDAYVQNVSRRLGVGPNDQIDLTDAKTLKALMTAIILQENNGINPYSDQQLDEAVIQSLQFARNAYKDQVGLVMPASGTVSSPFGHRDSPTEGASSEHQGVDIAGAPGSPIVAAASGTVEKAYDSSSYGKTVVIRHTDLTTRYGHMSAVIVKAGDQVTQGQQIGAMGSTGISTGTHLHFETEPNGGHPVDPATYLPQLGKGQHVVSTVVPPPQETTVVKSGSDLIKLKG